MTAIKEEELERLGPKKHELHLLELCICISVYWGAPGDSFLLVFPKKLLFRKDLWCQGICGVQEFGSDPPKHSKTPFFSFIGTKK